MSIVSSIKVHFFFLILVTLMILLVQQIFYQYTNGLIPEPGSLPLLNDTLVTLSDPRLEIEIFATGLKEPTNMAFLDSGDALILEKNNGTVRKIVNGNLVPEPLLDVSVATFDTRGMLGIAVAKNITVGKEYVFLYYTEPKDGQGDGEDECLSPSKCIPEYLPNGNRLYRYELSQDESKLINPKLIFSWPPFRDAAHNGGEITVGPDNNIYVIVGDGGNINSTISNVKTFPQIDGRGGILALDHDGRPAFSEGILGNQDPLNNYYAYGIRNGFGLDFDPLTGKLWDAENGPAFGDEINLVEPGFNSGYTKILGFWRNTLTNETEFVNDASAEDLVTFNGNGKYSSPELAWNQSIGPTAIKFFNSDKYGNEYQNDIFVGSVKPNGDLYHFDLNSNRTELDLQGPLEDRIADNYEELSNVIFGKNLGLITDITVGPDGYLYIVSLGRGEIYRIIPTDNLL